MAAVYLGVGSNVDAEENLKLAIDELRRRFGDLCVSGVYRNKPVGFDGDDFLNLVLSLETSISPTEVVEQLNEIHDLAGRIRGAERFVSRTLDIDLLLYDSLVLDQPPVRVPRSDVLEYSFVLQPLAEIAPGLRHPVTGRSIAEHWREFDAGRHPLQRTGVSL